MTDEASFGEATSQKATRMLSEGNVSNIVFDKSRKKALIFSKNMLSNQIRRDALKIQNSFDVYWNSELVRIDEQYSKACSLIYAVLTTDCYKENIRLVRSAELLTNATNSFTAAALLLRSGFVLQPGILLRTLIESVAIAINLCTDEQALEKYEAGRLDSGYAVKCARAVFPQIAKLYGYYSNQFSHVGEMHKAFTSVTDYAKEDIRVDANISMLKCCALTLYMTAELLYPDFVTAPRYWKPSEGGGSCFAPDESEKQWLMTFIGDDENDMLQALKPDEMQI